MRQVGALGISVGTSLAFELNNSSLLLGVDCVLLNLKTLVRNAHASYESGDTEPNNPDVLVKDVESDLALIAKWIETNRNNKPVRMTIYCPSYDNLESQYKFASVWKPTTEKQKALYSIYDNVVKQLLKKYPKLIQATKDTLPEFTGEGLVITHHVVDLVSVRGVGRVRLLESYTGVVKPFTEWYTKFTGGSELYFMPFNKLTIQIFGDKSVNFKTQPHAIKELVKKLAIDNKWSPLTTMSRVRSTIASLPSGVTKAGLLKMI